MPFIGSGAVYLMKIYAGFPENTVTLCGLILRQVDPLNSDLIDSLFAQTS